MKELVLVDSNVLVYANERSSIHYPQASEILSTLIQEGSATVSVQNLAEFSRVATEKLPRRISHQEARHTLLDLLPTLLVVAYTEKTVIEALRLAQIHEASFYDALIAATMLQHGIRTIVTENVKDFEKIPGIKAVNPF